MTEQNIILLLLIGIFLVIASVLLRVRSKGKYEIKTSDLVFVIVPLLIVGLATGKIQGLDLFGVKMDLGALWAQAAETRIEQQVSTSPLEDAISVIEPQLKGAVSEIPRLLHEKTQAIAFRLGMGGYYSVAIREYFDRLYGSSYLQYVVVNNADGTLFCMYDAADLITYLRTAGQDGYSRFEEMLNEGNSRATDWLSQLPGFVSSDMAVTPETSKRNALQAMEDFELNSLPVRDEGGRFIGTVERSKLTTSLILTVTDKLSSEDSASGK